MTKLCPFCGSSPKLMPDGDCFCAGNGTDDHPTHPPIRMTAERWNTRPQPAPPEGEPDDATIERVAEAIAMAGTSHFGDDTPYLKQDRMVRMMRRCEAQAAIAAYRLGLAARPKVEDAEVANAAIQLRNPNTAPIVAVFAADLLERLAGELAAWNAMFPHEPEPAVALTAARGRAEAAEAKLAEREAELATAYERIDEIAATPPDTPSGRGDDWQIGWQDGAMEAAAILRQADAARQQQKASAEKDKTHG